MARPILWSKYRISSPEIRCSPHFYLIVFCYEIFDLSQIFIFTLLLKIYEPHKCIFINSSISLIPDRI